MEEEKLENPATNPWSKVEYQRYQIIFTVRHWVQDWNWCHIPLPLCHPCSPSLNIRLCVLLWAHAMLLVTLYFVFVFVREAKENILHQLRTMNITPWQCGTGHERRKSPRPGYDLHLSTDTCTLQTIFVKKTGGIWKGKYLCIRYIYKVMTGCCIVRPVLL